MHRDFLQEVQTNACQMVLAPGKENYTFALNIWNYLNQEDIARVKHEKERNAGSILQESHSPSFQSSDLAKLLLSDYRPGPPERGQLWPHCC